MNKRKINKFIQSYFKNLENKILYIRGNFIYMRKSFYRKNNYKVDKNCKN